MTRKVSFLFCLLLMFLTGAPWAWAQGRAPAPTPAPLPGSRGERWSTYGHDGQRTNFQRFDRFFTLDSARKFQLVWTLKLAVGANDQITQPVVTDPVITTLGFRDIAVVADSENNVWGVDIDLGTILWHKQLKVAAPKLAAGTCPGGLTANLTFAPPVVFRFPRNFNPAAARGGRRGGFRGFFGGGGAGFGGANSVYILASDGSLHALAVSDGYEAKPGLAFLPAAGANASSLNMADSVAYTTTGGGCGGVPNAVWALDSAPAAHPVTHYGVAAPGASTQGGVAIGTDGTIYAQTPQALVALTAKTLQLKARHSFPGTPGAASFTPAVFSFAGRDVVATASPDGRVELLDGKNIAGAPLAQTAPLGQQIYAGVTTWEDASGTRWLVAPVWNGTHGTSGKLVAFKIEDHGGTPSFTQMWTSRAMVAPLPAVIIHGVGFALSGGQPGGPNAVLYAFNPATGAVLHASAPLGSWSRQTPSAANGYIYVTAHDGTLYQLGIHQEH